jgi:alkanesulfonate monooxygenase SsuD/methylene tetrahydromethanopterin reductase-like flavin-dependent oxidoreductase (luciferase family)
MLRARTHGAAAPGVHTMKFGVFFLLHSPNARPSDTVYRRALDEMAYADELGFDSVWLAEHHFSNYGYCPNPLTLAVKASSVTKNVRIGTAVLVLPFWHPLRLAEEIAMADVLTEGRLEVGVARGYQRYEFDRLGLRIEENRSRSDETLEVLLKMLRNVGISHQGEHFQIPETTTLPRPIQQPHPPIWLAASSEESIETAVRLGLNCFTAASTRLLDVPAQAWQTFAAKKRELGADVDFAVQQHVHVAPTDREAASRLDQSMWHFRQSTRLRTSTERVKNGVATADPIDGEPSLDEMYESRTFSGSPETVRQKIEAYTDRIELSQLNCIFSLGDLDQETVKSSMRLFADKVMPHFK